METMKEDVLLDSTKLAGLAILCRDYDIMSYDFTPPTLCNYNNHRFMTCGTFNCASHPPIYQHYGTCYSSDGHNFVVDERWPSMCSGKASLIAHFRCSSVYLMSTYGIGSESVCLAGIFARNEHMSIYCGKSAGARIENGMHWALLVLEELATFADSTFHWFPGYHNSKLPITMPVCLKSSLVMSILAS
jgi:hypothetical protein